ncbi:hypothetical protein G9A89_021119 [Geosiphon pyriformis]|nr:hypothetical protein G9A89_021119 [Geosiphon pyriformis]
MIDNNFIEFSYHPKMSKRKGDLSKDPEAKAAHRSRMTTVQWCLSGCRYYWGLGNDHDSIRAFRCFHRASGQGDLVAEKFLSKIFVYGHGTQKDLHQAIKYYRKAARDEQKELTQKFFRALSNKDIVIDDMY